MFQHSFNLSTKPWSQSNYRFLRVSHVSSSVFIFQFCQFLSFPQGPLVLPRPNRKCAALQQLPAPRVHSPPVHLLEKLLLTIFCAAQNGHHPPPPQRVCSLSLFVQFVIIQQFPVVLCIKMGQKRSIKDDFYHWHHVLASVGSIGSPDHSSCSGGGWIGLI